MKYVEACAKLLLYYNKQSISYHYLYLESFKERMKRISNKYSSKFRMELASFIVPQ